MNKTILAFGASSSKESINKKLATYAAMLIKDVEIEILDLNDFEMPPFSVDKESENGIPELAISFKKKVENADGIIISFAEHNSAYSVAFKNIFDWISRLEGSVWSNKPMLLLATSPGVRGGKSVLELASRTFVFMTNNTINSFSLPLFYSNYSEESGIIDNGLLHAFKEQLEAFEKSVKED